MDRDLPTLWNAVALEISLDLRGMEELLNLAHHHWNQAMGFVDGKLTVVDEDKFLVAQDFFAKAKGVEMRLS